MHKISKSKIVISAVIVAAIFVAGYLVWQHYRTDKAPNIKNNSSTPKIDYGPATDDQKDAAGINNTKNDAPSTSQSATENKNKPGNKKTVSVIVTTWKQKNGSITVNGYVDGIIESNGTCTLTLAKGGVIKTASRPAQLNTTNTTCGESDIPTSSLSLGTWQATLSYTSKTSSGTSDEFPVDVTND